MAYVSTTFVDTNTNITVGEVETLKTRVEELRLNTKREKELLDEWLSKSDGEQAMVELKKQQFRKLEKWNSMISMQRAGNKKRSLLRHFGKKKGKK